MRSRSCYARGRSHSASACDRIANRAIRGSHIARRVPPSRRRRTWWPRWRSSSRIAAGRWARSCATSGERRSSSRIGLKDRPKLDGPCRSACRRGRRLRLHGADRPLEDSGTQSPLERGERGREHLLHRHAVLLRRGGTGLVLRRGVEHRVAVAGELDRDLAVAGRDHDAAAREHRALARRVADADRRGLAKDRGHHGARAWRRPRARRAAGQGGPSSS